METAILWPLVLLTVSSFSAGDTTISTTAPPSGDQPSVHQQIYDNGLGAVVAQVVREQTAMVAKQQAIETTLAATQKELEATKSKLETTKTELEATKTKLQVAETKLEATETSLKATKTELEATKTDLKATKAKLQVAETKFEATETSLNATKTELEATKTKLEATTTKLEVTETNLNATKTQLMSKLRETTSELQAFRAEVKLGSSFVLWGRKTCPKNTVLVYEGVAGGKDLNEKGSGTNTLCLTRMPQFDDTPKPSHYGYLYGAEYETISFHQNREVPCSVCLAPLSTTIMVPATLSCPPGWTPQYSGHLASQYKDFYATEYVCLDGSPEDVSNAAKNDNGLLFYFVVTECGSLPCPPYINERVVTCVVCSK